MFRTNGAVGGRLYHELHGCQQKEVLPDRIEFAHTR